LCEAIKAEQVAKEKEGAEKAAEKDAKAKEAAAAAAEKKVVAEEKAVVKGKSSGLGVVSGGEKGGKVLQKEEVSADALQFLQVGFVCLLAFVSFPTLNAHPQPLIFACFLRTTRSNYKVKNGDEVVVQSLIQSLILFVTFASNFRGSHKPKWKEILVSNTLADTNMIIAQYLGRIFVCLLLEYSHCTTHVLMACMPKSPTGVDTAGH